MNCCGKLNRGCLVQRLTTSGLIAVREPVIVKLLHCVFDHSGGRQRGSGYEITGGSQLLIRVVHWVWIPVAGYNSWFIVTVKEGK